MPEHRDHDSELEALRDDYARLGKSEPDAATDARILAAARAAQRPRRSHMWTAAFATAACVGLAVVLVPALLVRSPDPQATSSRELVITQRDAEPAAPPPSREDVMSIGAPAVAPPAAVRERELAETRAETERRTREEIAADAQRPARQAMAQQKGAGFERLAALRTELADADETVWRERLLALRATGDEALAEALLADFRAHFGRSDTFTLDDLAAEADRNSDHK